MPKSLLPQPLRLKPARFAAALLLCTTALGATLALASDRSRHTGADTFKTASDGLRPAVRVASEHGADRHQDRHDRRQASNDDDDDDDEDEAGSPGPELARPSGPGVPVPDNGLFTGPARPRVDVQ